MSKGGTVLNWLLCLLMRLLLNEMKQRSLERLRISAAKFYVQSVSEVRRLALGLIAVVVVIAILVSGCTLMPIGIAIFIYNNTGNPNISGIIILTVGAIFVAIPAILLRVFSSERLWMRVFRVRQIAEFASTRGKSERN